MSRVFIFLLYILICISRCIIYSAPDLFTYKESCAFLLSFACLFTVYVFMHNHCDWQKACSHSLVRVVSSQSKLFAWRRSEHWNIATIKTFFLCNYYWLTVCRGLLILPFLWISRSHSYAPVYLMCTVFLYVEVVNKRKIFTCQSQKMMNIGYKSFYAAELNSLTQGSNNQKHYTEHFTEEGRKKRLCKK